MAEYGYVCDVCGAEAVQEGDQERTEYDTLWFREPPEAHAEEQGGLLVDIDICDDCKKLIRNRFRNRVIERWCKADPELRTRRGIHVKEKT